MRSKSSPHNFQDKETATTSPQSSEESDELSNYVGALLLRHIMQLICNASAIQHVLPEEGSEVEEENLSVIVNQLSEVNLSQTKLSGGQCKELFRKMIEGTNLKVFKINEVDLSAVPANTLAEAIIQVEDIEMSKTKLSIYQGIYIFSKLSEKPKTKKLKIDNNDFSLVPVDYISKGVNKLKEVDLVGSKLTDIQMTAIFIEMLDNSTIEKIALDGDVESRYNEFVKSLKDRVNVIVTFDRSHEITTIHLFKKF